MDSLIDQEHVVKRPVSHTAVLLCASAFGLGYLPAPGTFGTLLAIPLWYALARLPLPAALLVTLAAIVLAIVAADAAERIYGSHDVQHIVVDEVVGLLVAGLGVPFRWPEILAAFLLFRLFDIVKPPPVSWLDRKVPGGLGVVLDDVGAGLLALAVLHGARAISSW